MKLAWPLIRWRKRSPTIAAIRQRGHHKIVVKESLGLAGSNAMRLFEPEVLESHRRWIANAVENGRQLVVEPWLERELDFSVQLEMADDGLKLCGYTGLINDAQRPVPGQCRAAGPPEKNSRGFARAVPGTAGHCAAVARALRGHFCVCWRRNCAGQNFSARWGLMLLRIATRMERSGSSRSWKSIRATRWAALTVELMKHVAPGSRGEFRLVSRKQAQAEGFADFTTCAGSLTRTFSASSSKAIRHRESAKALFA